MWQNIFALITLTITSGKGSNCFTKFPIIWAKSKILGQRQKSNSLLCQMQKKVSFCKRRFFLENTLVLGRKVRNLKEIILFQKSHRNSFFFQEKSEKNCFFRNQREILFLERNLRENFFCLHPRI